MDKVIVIGIGILVIVLVVALVWCVVMAVVNFGTEAKCLEAGWKEARVTWNFQLYCVREENEYEIVRPLSEILAEQ